MAIRALNDGSERVLTRFKKGYFFTPVFAPDGRSLSFTDGDHRLWQVGLNGGSPIKVAQDKRQGIRDQVYSPDGRWLAFSMAGTAKRRDIYLYEVATGRTHRLGKARAPRRTRPGLQTAGGFTLRPPGMCMPFPRTRNRLCDGEVTGVYMVDLPQDPARIVHEDLMSNATVVAIEPANIVQLNVRDDGIYYLSQPLSTFDGFLKGEKSALHRFDLDTEQDTVLAEDMDSYSLSLVGQKVLIKREVTTRCWMLRRDMLRKRNRG